MNGMASQVVLMVENLPSNAGDAAGDAAGATGSIPGPGRFPGEGNGNLLQYSCLENPTDSPWGHRKVRHDLATKQQQAIKQSREL